MTDSILETTKKLMGIADGYTAFDTDIIVFINSALMVLQQLGVGPKEGLVVTDSSQTWSDLNPDGIMQESIKQYIYLSVKMVFDPPASSFVMDAMKQKKEELEWRLREQAEFYPGDGTRLGYYQALDANAESEDEDDDCYPHDEWDDD